MAYHPTIGFFVTATPTGLMQSFQAELDCDAESEEEINANIVTARVDLKDKYNIEEV